MNTQENTQQPETGTDGLIGLTSAIVAAFVGGGSNHVNAEVLPQLIRDIHGALTGLSDSTQVAEQKEPAVSIKQSIKPDYIVCLEDGKKLKMLKRYIMSRYGLTPDQYRNKWGLSADYPMVAPNYAETRRTLAKAIGLGTKRARASGAGANATASTGTGRKAATASSGKSKIDGRSKEARAAKAASAKRADRKAAAA